ncbi:MAG: hypothetical protein AAF431_00365 [Pseudomonadota bacterium]
MSDGYSRSPLLLKGALIEFSERFIGPIPNIIIFQYNPSSFTRNLEVYQPPLAEAVEGEGGDTEVQRHITADAQPHDPPESFTLELELDATDELEIGDPIAVLTGVADRIAAMEILLYPQEGSLLGDLLGSVSISLGGGGANASAEAQAEPVPRGRVPILLFVWGPGKIVPVRLTSFSVEEQAHSPILYPTQAKVSLGVKVLSEEELNQYEDSISKDIAIGAYKFTRTQKEVLAASNLANTVQSILGMLPF